LLAAAANTLQLAIDDPVFGIDRGIVTGRPDRWISPSRLSRTILTNWRCRRCWCPAAVIPESPFEIQSQRDITGSAPEQFSLTMIESASRGSRQRVRKLIAFDDETFDKLKQLARDRMGTIQELADEAFADLLRKHGIPVDLRDALRKSASPDNARSSPSRKKKS
jgi:hypothetical protein